MPSDFAQLRGLQEQYLKTAEWELKFAWVPRRCTLSKQYFWLRRGYKTAAQYKNFGDFRYPVNANIWHSTEEHLLWLLTK